MYYIETSRKEIEMSNEIISKESFIKNFKRKHDIDFRKDIHVTPTNVFHKPRLNYDRAVNIVKSLNDELEVLFSQKYTNNYITTVSRRVAYNLDMDIDSFRGPGTLKQYIYDRVGFYYS